MKRKHRADTNPQGESTPVKNEKEKKAKRRVWTSDEDKAIISLIEQYGPKNWTHIATKLRDDFGIKGRTGKQCRER